MIIISNRLCAVSKKGKADQIATIIMADVVWQRNVIDLIYFFGD